MHRCPSGSTLFPYTTLFRSERRGLDHARAYDRNAEQVGLVLHEPVVRGCAAVHPQLAGAPGDVVLHRGDQVAALEDRKSTRLNSSHLGISYAVFCLKKKTET